MIKDKIHVEIEMEQKMSPQARKLDTQYYELKLQLRFTYFDKKELENNVLEKFGKIVQKNFDKINKIEELDNGFDFFFASLSQLNKISRYFNKYFFIDEKRSKKIVGHDFLKCKDIWRHTILINILNLNIGDEIRIKGEEYYIKAFNKKELVLRDLISGSKKVVTYNKISDYFELIKKNSEK